MGFLVSPPGLAVHACGRGEPMRLRRCAAEVIFLMFRCALRHNGRLQFLRPLYIGIRLQVNAVDCRTRSDDAVEIQKETFAAATTCRSQLCVQFPHFLVERVGRFSKECRLDDNLEPGGSKPI